MEKCYEYFNCSQKQCAAHTEEVICWEIEGTLCNTAHIEGFQMSLQELTSDSSKCDHCIYKKQLSDPDMKYDKELNYP